MSNVHTVSRRLTQVAHQRRLHAHLLRRHPQSVPPLRGYMTFTSTEATTVVTVPTKARTFSTSTESRFVRIVEVSGRDGLQNISSPIVPVTTKLTLLTHLLSSGLRDIEVGSFVRPDRVKQMANTTELLPMLPEVPHNGSFSVLVPNARGLENLVKLEKENGKSEGQGEMGLVNEVAVFVSATEAFSQANNNASVSKVLSTYTDLIPAARAHGYRVRGYVSCVITDPYSGATEPSEVVPVVQRLLEMGCYEVSLGDTTGEGDPASWGRLWSALREAGVPASQMAAHCHDTFALALSSIISLLPHGLRTIDSSLAGLGGCPYSPGATGNVPTEDVVHALHKLGYETGVDLDKLVDAGEWLSSELGVRNESRVGRALWARKQVRSKQEVDKKDA